MTPKTRAAWLEGCLDAIGFVAGALVGWLIARAVGFDFMASPNWDAAAMVGILLVGLFAGIGRAACRHLGAAWLRDVANAKR